MPRVRTAASGVGSTGTSKGVNKNFQSDVMKRFGWTVDDIGATVGGWEGQKATGGAKTTTGSWERYVSNIAHQKALRESPAYRKEWESRPRDTFGSISNLGDAITSTASNLAGAAGNTAEGLVDFAPYAAAGYGISSLANLALAPAPPPGLAVGNPVNPAPGVVAPEVITQQNAIMAGAPGAVAPAVVGGAALTPAAAAGGAAAALAPAAATLAPADGLLGDTFLNSILGASALGTLYSASEASDAAEDAADAQLDAVREGINFQREALETTRQDLAPFREFGAGGMDVATQNLQNVSNLVNDPNAQVDFIQNNPFFDLLAQDAQRRIFNQSGAVGKKQSGGTAEALQNSIMLLGNNLVGDQVNRGLAVNQAAQNQVGIGANAAARQATASQATGANLSNLATQGGNAAAAGTIGAQNAETQGINNLINAALQGYGIHRLG